MTFDFNPSDLTDQQRLAVIDGTLPAASLNGNGPKPGIPTLLMALGNGDGTTGLNAGAWLSHVEAATEGLLRFNDLERQIEYDGTTLPPDETELLYAKAQQRGHKVGKQPCLDGLLCHALSNRYDPIRDYLEHLEQNDDITAVDIETLSTNYLGTTDNLSDAILRVALIGAVARRLDPGCQFDVVVVLKGDQGIRKSTFWKVLASPRGYCSSVPDNDKDLILNIHSSWLFELAELEYITGKRAVGQLKNLLTTSSDLVRVPYGKATEPRHRASIFVASVNSDSFLRDETGSRRYLVIDLPQQFNLGELIDIEKVIQDRDRIWKAAVLAYRAGAKPMLDAELQRQSNEQNVDYEAESPFLSQLCEWLASPGCPDQFTSDQALVKSGCRGEGRITRADQMEVANLLANLGYVKTNRKITVGHVRGRFWSKPTNQPQTDEVGQEVGGEVGQDQNPGHDNDLLPTDQPDQPLLREIEKGGNRGTGGVDTKGGEIGWSGWSPAPRAPLYDPLDESSLDF